MNRIILVNVNDKSNYLHIIELSSKDSLSDNEVNELFTIYKNVLFSIYKIDDDDFIRIIMYSDIQSLNNKLDAKSKDCLEKMKSLMKNDVAITLDIDTMLADDTINKYLKIALVRITLDAYSIKPNINDYKEDIQKLVNFISTVDDDDFYKANLFIGIIRSVRF